MGKRTDRSRDKNSVQDEELGNLTDTQSPYSCTGQFQTDFVELCRRVEPPFELTPAVVLRPRRPRSPTPMPVVEEKMSKSTRGSKKEEKTQALPEQETETPSLAETGEPAEPPPKTYVTKDRFEYFKPCIQVEMDNPDKLDSVTEVHIRGWKIDEIMMNIFQQCWTMMAKLHTINLWSAGLTDATLESLASFTRQCSALRILSLDNNRVSGEAWHLLMKDDSPVQHLSLRYNGITDVGAECIGSALGNFTQQNQRVLSLNLAGNKITDVGARHIANGLRFNRCLLSLCLAGNCIGDVGVKSLAEMLSRFSLTHEEIVARRILLSNTIERKPSQVASSTYRREKVETRERPGSVRSNTGASVSAASKGSKSTKTKKGDARANKEEDAKHDKTKGKLKEPEKTAKRAALAPEAAKSTAKKVDKRGKKATQPEPDAVSKSSTEVGELSEAVNPLLEPVESLPDGTVLIKGNMTLINLNLAGNGFGEPGAEALLHAIRYQTTLSQFTLQAKVPSGIGLLRISIQRNQLGADSANVKLINALMSTRDPIQKPLSTTGRDSRLSD